jgi:pilus assembly protein CpaD
MTHKLSLLLLASVTLAGCQVHRGVDRPARGILPVNEPVVARTDYVFDAAAPAGALDPSEAARLDGWFRGLELGYGDVISLDGADTASARSDVARIAGRYGLLISEGGAPVTAGAVPPGAVRVVVSRTRASVPGCPNWSQPSGPNYNNELLSGFGCAVNGNLAAMVANPADLISGRESSGTDASAGTRAIQSLRTRAQTGEGGGLQAVSSKGGN